MLEAFHQPRLPRRQFAARMLRFGLGALALDGAVLVVGMIGYRAFEDLAWLDAGVNAALVMTGNGPVHAPQTPAGKLFTIFFSIVGVMSFAVVISVLVVPVIHRMLHAPKSRHAAVVEPPANATRPSGAESSSR